jgi:hydroxymethylglutaryl-CoA lyase
LKSASNTFQLCICENSKGEVEGFWGFDHLGQVVRFVKILLEFLKKHGIPVSKLAGHFHDTYGQAMSNVWQAYLCGVRVFDSSVGGLGGCPFAPGAKGNAATEDLVYLFEQAGIQTGVNLPKLVEVGNWISAQLRKPNDSRAGMALAFAGPVAVKPELSPAEKNGKPRLAWNLYKETENLQIYRSGVNLKVVLHRPQSSNTLTTSMIADLTQIFEEAKSDATITRIAITGSGKYFCAGMDLGKGASPVAQSKAASDAQYERLHRLFETIDNAPQVTIACINGPASGGGVGLAFACDIRIAAESATVTLSEVKLGLCAATISKYLVRKWGLAFTREAMLSARPISVMELKSLGLLARVVDDPGLLSDELDLYLGQLKIAGPQASQMSKELMRLGWAHAGDIAQEAGIKGLFDRMMRPNSEAAVGLKAFQLARRPLDWDQIVLSQSIPRAKL